MEKEFYSIEIHETIVLDMCAPVSTYNELRIESNNKIGCDEKFALDYNFGFLLYGNKNSKEMMYETLIPYVEEY